MREFNVATENQKQDGLTRNARVFRLVLYDRFGHWYAKLTTVTAERWKEGRDMESESESTPVTPVAELPPVALEATTRDHEPSTGNPLSARFHEPPSDEPKSRSHSKKHRHHSKLMRTVSRIATAREVSFNVIIQLYRSKMGNRQLKMTGDPAVNDCIPCEKVLLSNTCSVSGSKRIDILT
eukprot:1177267-Prorocentrum_minimum.AAC.4